MELIAVLVLIYAIKCAVDDARKAYRKSKAAYMRSIDDRFPSLPKPRRAVRAVQHDLGYWSAHALRGFPVARRGFAAGWQEGRQAKAEGKPVPKSPRSLWRDVEPPEREDRPAAGEGRENAGEGSRDFPVLLRVRSKSGRKVNPLTGAPSDVATVYDDDDLQRRLDAAAQDPDLEVTTEPLSAPEAAATVKPRGQQGQDHGDCYLCGQPLAAGAGYSHKRCEEVYRKDCAAHEVGDNRDLDEVERDLRDQGKCPWQIRPAGWDGGAVYCGQLITDSGGDEPDLFCLQHQAEADGDDWGAAQELNEHVQSLLERQEQQEAGHSDPHACCNTPGCGCRCHGASAEPETAGLASRQPAGTEITTEGTPSMPVAADITYDGVLRSMTVSMNNAEARAAEIQQASREASVMSEQMQGLEVDPATLSAMADHLDAHDTAVKAQLRVQETAETVEAALRRGHAGLAEAHQNAPVRSATREFYED